jgi:hypothetical protein
MKITSVPGFAGTFLAMSGQEALSVAEVHFHERGDDEPINLPEAYAARGAKLSGVSMQPSVGVVVADEPALG